MQPLIGSTPEFELRDYPKTAGLTAAYFKPFKDSFPRLVAFQFAIVAIQFR